MSKAKTDSKQDKKNSPVLLWMTVVSSILTVIGIGSYWIILQSTQSLEDLVVIPRYSPFFIVYFLLLSGVSITCVMKSKGRRKLGLIILTVINIGFLGFLIFMSQVLSKSGA